jgi:hypothetical protein
MTERDRLELNKFLQEEKRIEDIKKKAESDAAELERLKAEVKVNAARAFKAHQKLLLGKREIPLVSETVMYLTFQSEQEKAQWQEQESQAFRLAHPEYEKYRSYETSEQLLDVYRAHYRGEGTPIMCREMLAYAFAKCLEDGTLAEPVTFTSQNVPAVEVTEPEPDWDLYPRIGLNDIRPGLAHHVAYTDGMEGVDQSNGEYRHFSELEISRMDSTTFKRTFSNGRIL